MQLELIIGDPEGRMAVGALCGERHILVGAYAGRLPDSATQPSFSAHTLSLMKGA